MKEDNKEFELEQLNDDEIDAYLEVTDEETPDLWDRISSGFDNEISKEKKIVDLQAAKKRRKKILSGYLAAAAAVLLIVLVAVNGLLDVKDRTSNDFAEDGVYETESTVGVVGDAEMGDGNMQAEAPADDMTSAEIFEDPTETFVPGSQDAADNIGGDSPASNETFDDNVQDDLIASDISDNSPDSPVSNDNADEPKKPDTANDTDYDKVTENIEITDGINETDSAKPSTDSTYINVDAVLEISFKTESEITAEDANVNILSKKEAKNFIKLFNKLELGEKVKTDEAIDVTYTVYYDDGRVCEIGLSKKGKVFLDGVCYEADKATINELIDLAN